jgi:hypothetical protein
MGGDADSSPDEELCSPGDTRECVGPGACRGGQICSESGWSDCDCAGSVAAGGETGGEGNDSRALAGAGGEAPTTGGASTSQAGATGIDYTPDECPPTVGCFTPPLDCGGDCPHPGCEIPECPIVSTCRMEVYGTKVLSTELDTDTAIARIPSAATIGGPCECASGTPIVAKFLTDLVPPQPTDVTHYEVRLPWHLGLPTDGTQCAPVAPTQCQNHDRYSPYNRLQAWTTDPDAPAVNVHMKRGPCPE